MQTIVVLTGSVADSSVLYSYLGDLDSTDFFEKAELDCLNSLDGRKGAAPLQFRAVLTVLPGYGQPGGPKGPEIHHVVKAASRRSRTGEPKP